MVSQALRSVPFMAEELSYVIINPYTIYKSRTGGVLARLLTRTSLDLVGAQMFAPSQALIDEYAQNIVTEADPQDRKIQELIRDYVKENLAPDPVTGLRERVMMLLFRGENAVRRIRETVGTFKENFLGGESIRDTYGDIVFNRDRTVRYFEPAVLASPNVAGGAHQVENLGQVQRFRRRAAGEDRPHGGRSAPRAHAGHHQAR